MRRSVAGLGLAVLLAAVVGLTMGSASAAGNKKLVEGTVYDTTCAGACVPECPPPPPCGPVTATQSSARVVCALRKPTIACPLYRGSPLICLPETPCGGTAYPVYSGEGATVNVRKRGSSTVLATLAIVEGNFEIRLGPGQYVLHPRLLEEPCWTGEPWMVTVQSRMKGPLPVSLNVSNTCVVHPAAK